MAELFDFSGWATRNNLRCSDGRVIRQDAFAHNDGEVVPLMWQHDHSHPENIVGHALLENRPEGVYAYCSLNDSSQGYAAREAVKHGDIESLSIYANNLKQNGGDVIHGNIREVSLVMHGANPGAYIDNVMMHGDREVFGEEGRVYNGELIDTETPYELYHMGPDDEEDDYMYEDSYEEYDDYGDGYEDGYEDAYEDGYADAYADLSHADTSGDFDDDTVDDVVNNMTDEQKLVLAYLVGKAAEDLEIEHSEEMEDLYNMKWNAFSDSYGGYEDPAVLQHGADLMYESDAIFEDAKRLGSLKDSVLMHANTYGIADIDWLFPDAKNLNIPPEFIKRDDDWVNVFLNSVKRTPFSRIKSMFADITATEARAKGYIKGKQKTEEIFTLLKRTTTPTTIYKKQKLDKDDLNDITDFDIVAWLRTEMRMMLNEEIARAALVGDGRSGSSDDKIDETHIRPIWTDADLYTIKTTVTDNALKYKNFIAQCVRARKDYKGTGSPTLFTTEEILAEMLLLEDGIGHRLYKNMDDLASAIRVSKIVTVEVMENLTRTVTDTSTSTSTVHTLAGIIVNPADYNIGADKGGAISFFDDFDIDFNQQKYLIETRCSGALIKPYSAIAIEFIPDTSSNSTGD